MMFENFNLLDGLYYEDFEFNEQEIRMNPDKADWFAISYRINTLPINFLREFRDYIRWEQVNFRKFRTTGFLDEFNRDAEDKINKYYSLKNFETNELVSGKFSFVLQPYPKMDEIEVEDIIYEIGKSNGL